jgi:hypothetical protein
MVPLAAPMVVFPKVRVPEVDGLTVKLKVAVPVPPALVALKLMLEVPAADGVPEMSPVTVLIESPAGKPVALKLVGLLVAVIW